MIQLKRAYEAPTDSDGLRVLVDRLWPRGVSKTEARIDEWAKDLAPSNELRRSFHANLDEWGTFEKRYRAELTGHDEALRALAARAKGETVTLVFGAKDTQRNQAVVLKKLLEGCGADGVALDTSSD